MPGARSEPPEGRPYSTVGLAFAVISLVFLPILFAPLAVVFGIIGVRRHDRNRGIAAVALGILVIAVFLAVNVL